MSPPAGALPHDVDPPATRVPGVGSPESDTQHAPRQLEAPPFGGTSAAPVRRGGWLVIAGRSARAAGVLLLLFLVYALFGSALLEGHAQESLNRATHLRVTSADIGLDSLVTGSDSSAALGEGPGVVPGSGKPGSSQPIVIVGHRVAAGALSPSDGAQARI